jgi:hypothetical protein
LLAIVRSNCFHVLSTAGVDVGWAMEEIWMDKWRNMLCEEAVWLDQSYVSLSFLALQENLLQLPPVDMQLLWFYFCCNLNLTQITLQNNFNAQSLCIVHSDCARKVFLN